MLLCAPLGGPSAPTKAPNRYEPGQALAHPDAAGRMTAYFQDAGLKRPTIFCEIPVGGGPDSPLCAWLARTVRSVLPQLEEIGAATAAEVDIDTLEDRLRDAVSAVHSQVLCPMQFCGWTKL